MMENNFRLPDTLGDFLQAKSKTLKRWCPAFNLVARIFIFKSKPAEAFIYLDSLPFWGTNDLKQSSAGTDSWSRVKLFRLKVLTICAWEVF